MDPTRWPLARSSSAGQPDTPDPHKRQRRRRMKFTAQLLIAAILVFAAGCAKTDWIDRTLVTVDVRCDSCRVETLSSTAPWQAMCSASERWGPWPILEK